MRIRNVFYTPSSSSLEPLLKSTLGDNSDLEEDIDVQTERNRVLSGGVGSAVIYLRNLRKVLSTSQFSTFRLNSNLDIYKLYISGFRCIQEGSNMVQKLLFIH